MPSHSSTKQSVFLFVLILLGCTVLGYAMWMGGYLMPSLNFIPSPIVDHPDRMAAQIKKHLIKKQGDPADVPRLVMGDSRQQLQKLLGSPCGEARHGDSQKLYYEAGAVFLKNGFVEEVPHDFVQRNLELRLQTRVNEEMKIRGWVHYEGRWMREGEYQLIKAERKQQGFSKKRKKPHRCRAANYGAAAKPEIKKRAKKKQEFTLTSFDHGMKKKRKQCRAPR